MKLFPISLPYRFHQKATAGTGTTVSMGSRIIHLSERLRPGPVQLVIDWPATLDDGCALSLAVFGRVQRGGRYVSVSRHEFRVRSRMQQKRTA